MDVLYLALRMEEIKSAILPSGHLAEGQFINGLAWHIEPTLFGSRLGIGQPNTFVYDDVWCYAGFEDAHAAVRSWGGYGEPTGWHRHPRTGRRRPGGDASLEVSW